jgi:hypothetical protein
MWEAIAWDNLHRSHVKLVINFKSKYTAIMNEYLLIIHRDISKEGSPSPQQLQEVIKPFQDWIGGIAAQNKLAATPKRWDIGGKVVKQNNVVTDGPYAEIKEAVSGTILIRANDYDEAAEIAKGCPVLKWGSVVEVRMALPTPTV